MADDADIYARRLSRLPDSYYCGRTVVHWSMSMEHRATGWLNELHHAKLREWLCHALARHHLVCPAYCLMPDHGHFLWMGWREESNQRSAAALFRQCWNRELQRSACQLQRQAYDHVLRDTERTRGALTETARYIFENPVKAGLVAEGYSYPYLGAVIPGYPDLDPWNEDGWARLWRIYDRLAKGGQ